jgi:hypothetical protein
VTITYTLNTITRFPGIPSTMTITHGARVPVAPATLQWIGSETLATLLRGVAKLPNCVLTVNERLANLEAKRGTADRPTFSRVSALK